jgi:hypothetical protein
MWCYVLYAHSNTISNRIWICVAIIYHLQIQIKIIIYNFVTIVILYLWRN